MANEIKCGRCENRMEFGGASKSMRRQFSAGQMLENLALASGWKRIAGAWECRLHGE